MFLNNSIENYKYITFLAKLFSGMVAVAVAILAEYIFIHVITFTMQSITLVLGMVLVAMVFILERMVKLTTFEQKIHKMR